MLTEALSIRGGVSPKLTHWLCYLLALDLRKVISLSYEMRIVIPTSWVADRENQRN